MRSLRVLITGGTGLLGKTLLEDRPGGMEVSATYHHHAPPPEWRSRFFPLDICDKTSVLDLWRTVRPEIVIHTASVGSVDEAELNPAWVRRVNVEGTRHVVEASRQAGAFLVHISSNAVFDGLNPPYKEDSVPSAVNLYGEIKSEAEAEVRENRLPHLIVRPILMYGWPFPGGRSNAVTRWLSQLEKEQTVEVAEDIISMPLWIKNCAETIWAGITQKRTGIVHVAGADRVNLFAFAQEMSRVFGCDERLLIPVPSAHITGLAPRPWETSFDTTQMSQEFGVRPIGLREGLTLMRQSRDVSVWPLEKSIPVSESTS